MKFVILFLICFLRAEQNQKRRKKCGQIKREPIWSRLPSKLDNFGQVLDQKKNVRKIMGGNKLHYADPGNFPWQAALAINSEIFCGGTLVSPKMVISHRLADYQKPEDLVVSVGHISTNFERIYEDGHQSSTVKKIINHPDYIGTPFYVNDISLLLIKESFEITDYVRPACLPKLSVYRPQNGAVCVASGFGQEEPCNTFKRFYTSKLKNVVLEIVDNEKCALKKHGFELENYQLCAAGLQNGIDTCDGDSGGPLVCDVKGRWTLTGVLSFGLIYGEKEIPGVYTNVADYLDWIWNNSEMEPRNHIKEVTPTKTTITTTATTEVSTATSTTAELTTIDPSETNILVIFENLAASYMTNGDGSETSAVQISAPGIMPIMGQPIHYAHWAKSAVVKGKLYLFGGWIDNKKIARLDDCTFVELPYKLNFYYYQGHAALSISKNSEALICFDITTLKSCDIFTGSSVVSTYSTSFVHINGGLGFYNGQPITVGSSRSAGYRKVETLSSTGWTRLADSPMNNFGHILIGLGNDLLMIGGQDNGYFKPFTSHIWRLSDNSWSQEADLKQNVVYGSAIAIGNSIFIVGGRDRNNDSYSQRIDLDENDEIAGIEQIGVLDGDYYILDYYFPALLATSQDYCVSN